MGAGGTYDSSPNANWADQSTAVEERDHERWFAEFRVPSRVYLVGWIDCQQNVIASIRFRKSMTLDEVTDVMINDIGINPDTSDIPWARGYIKDNGVVRVVGTSAALKEFVHKELRPPRRCTLAFA